MTQERGGVKAPYNNIRVSWKEEQEPDSFGRTEHSKAKCYLLDGKEYDDYDYDDITEIVKQVDEKYSGIYNTIRIDAEFEDGKAYHINEIYYSPDEATRGFELFPTPDEYENILKAVNHSMALHDGKDILREINNLIEEHKYPLVKEEKTKEEDIIRFHKKEESFDEMIERLESESQASAHDEGHNGDYDGADDFDLGVSPVDARFL